MAKHEIIKYHNDLNKIPLGHLTACEINIFFSIVTRMQNKGAKEISLSYCEIKRLSKYKGNSHKRFVQSMKKLRFKLKNFISDSNSPRSSINEKLILFSKFDISQESNQYYVKVQIHEEAIFLLNHLSLSGEFIRYSLEELILLKRSYSKTLFRYLKQYRTTGKLILTTEKFNEFFAPPKSYKQNSITMKILNPAINELKYLFKNLKVTKEYKKGNGNPIKKYTFTFTPEAKNADVFKSKKSFTKTISSTDSASKSFYKKSRNIDFSEHLLEEEITKLDDLPEVSETRRH